MDKGTASRDMYMEYLEEFAHETKSPQITEEEMMFRKLQEECEEYAKLKFTCQRLLLDAPKVVEGKTDLGNRIYMNIEVRDTKHVVVKMTDEIFVEMKLQDAIKFCDRRMDMYKNMLQKTQDKINELKTDMTILLGSMDIPYLEPNRYRKSEDPFRGNKF
ncbi:hypothetical protein CAEBREN_04425 [Caenorhabditis brenneri]|uniref:Uncharacterized protein n=1 Tax=Caenorhabditis brenneri TaxID=135651 RepID=G0P5M2_CAEBE|nr:hypothetical protein CAEBREN_04425 [Caenorhabditis brenneri]